MDLLARGSDWLERTRVRFAATEVMLRRGASTATVLATIGKHTFQVDAGDGVLLEVESRDYLILATDYTVDDVAVLPRAGDQILEGDPGDPEIYEVMAPSGFPVWVWSDPYRQTLRVHTKNVARASSP